MVPHLRDICQVFGLEVHDVPLIFYLPLTLAICEHPKDLGVVWVCIEPIIWFGIYQLKVILSIDRLHAKVYQNPSTRTFLST